MLFLPWSPFTLVPWEPGRKSPGAVGGGEGDWQTLPGMAPCRRSAVSTLALLCQRTGPRQLKKKKKKKACFVSEEGELEALTWRPAELGRNPSSVYILNTSSSRE